eukprot:CAMPEP_0181542178 /NCGR_PEP_ID=MMETSP1110-20121109/77778_1 /TAXON_ID=174948 /ORGANISM="Symbiodinium sp., Strain CCMP421" /LENGTH=174 /DNA_ID=CAMNT_0023673863 /DNA_START=224 /DNA_END=748 /DNA_ORIENTATION=-
MTLNASSSSSSESISMSSSSSCAGAETAVCSFGFRLTRPFIALKNLAAREARLVLPPSGPVFALLAKSSDASSNSSCSSLPELMPLIQPLTQLLTQLLAQLLTHLLTQLLTQLRIRVLLEACLGGQALQACWLLRKWSLPRRLQHLSAELQQLLDVRSHRLGLPRVGRTAAAML